MFFCTESVVPTLDYLKVNMIFLNLFFYLHLRTFFYCFEREKHQCEREVLIGSLPYTPRLGIVRTLTREITPTRHMGMMF